MKLASKLIAVSALASALVATSAFAQIPRASDPAGSGVYVGVWDTTKNVSIVQYLGFQEQNTAGVALGTTWQLTDWSALSGSTTDHLVFEVSGAFTGGSTTTSIVTTGPQSGLGTVVNGNVASANPLIDAIIAAVNTDCGTSSCVSDSSTSLHLASFAGQNGANYTNSLQNASATGAVGTDALAWYFARRTGVSGATAAAVNQIGVGLWTLSSTGLLKYDAVSAVPLPAALWLLLSGLAGVATVGRRKTAA